ncbi:hypothetical protein SAZ10_29525 [Mesorhizobium sp. BAC0120]|uniref:hypothetical protein n=1 Tax=Mesorhizobium sp. BAC0120 TaxID=3090670 RepID=UPI00298D4A12|nr:hypothetical protein [Mesorhizobium sp. BAC0120]MDW6025907.1 hypothetical protein [Mesorhizobium sp. BAC0120]
MGFETGIIARTGGTENRLLGAIAYGDENHGRAVRRNPMKVVNNSKALQGVNTSKGVVYLRPGELKDVDFTKEGLEQARRLPFLALRGDKDDKAAADNERDELKKQADELGIEYAKNIPADKLKELVDAKLAE